MRNRWLGFVIATLAVAASIWAYPRLPGSVAIHWNLLGEPDGFGSRLLAVSILPLIMIVLTAALQLLPAIDRRREHDAAFLDTYWIVVNGLLVFLGVVHAAVLANGMGAPVGPGTVVPVGLGILFVLIGVRLSRVPPNGFLGVRTPWTVASEGVWRATHRSAGVLFAVGGIVVVTTALVRSMIALPVLFAVLVVVAVVPVIQSYALWSKEQSDESRR